MNKWLELIFGLILVLGGLIVAFYSQAWVWLGVSWNFWHAAWIFLKGGVFWFVVMIVGARSAARLILVFVPVTTILASYLIVNAIEYSMKLKKDTYKIIAYLLIFFIVFSPFGSAVSAIPIINKIPIINHTKKNIDSLKYLRVGCL